VPTFIFIWALLVLVVSIYFYCKHFCFKKCPWRGRKLLSWNLWIPFRNTKSISHSGEICLPLTRIVHRWIWLPCNLSLLGFLFSICRWLWVPIVGAYCLHFLESRLYFSVWNRSVESAAFISPSLRLLVWLRCFEWRCEAILGDALGFIVSSSISRFLPLLWSIDDVCIRIRGESHLDFVDRCRPLSVAASSVWLMMYAYGWIDLELVVCSLLVFLIFEP
jgi:hypothetical protein